MASTDHTIVKADGWTKIADDGVDFQAENKHHQETIHYTFSVGAPAASAPFHRCKPGDFFIRAGSVGDCYILNPSAAQVTVTVS